MRSLTVSLLLGVVAVPAWAGPNAGGVLAVDGLEAPYSTSDLPICEAFGGDLPFDCNDLVTNIPEIGLTVFVWQVVAIFPELATPRLAGTTFGIDYVEASPILVEFGPCGDFELTTDGWPGPNTGVAVTWNDARTEHVVPVYMFAGYEYYGPSASFDLVPHPNGGALFADDAIPSKLDAVYDLGRLGFGTEEGYAPCPGPAAGACCNDIFTGECRVISEQECFDAFGNWLGEATDCDPDPCQIKSACCFPDGSCEELLRSECLAEGGAFRFGFPCSDVPCGPVPVLESSWGMIKRGYQGAR